MTLIPLFEKDLCAPSITLVLKGLVTSERIRATKEAYENRFAALRLFYATPKSCLANLAALLASGA